MSDTSQTAAGDNPRIPTGGLIIEERLLGASIDFLTVTVPGSGAMPLLASTEKDREGSSSDGYKKSEIRSLSSGVCFRRYEPISEYLGFGKDHESWRFPGPNASDAAPIARAIDGSRASYIDVAFDYRCEKHHTSDMVLDMFRPHMRERGIKAGIAGEEDINTRYVGSKKSERRIKIYRKDLDDKAYAAQYGPTIRIEPTLKGKHAHNAWAVYVAHGPQELYRLMSGHVWEMTGYRVWSSKRDVPEVVYVSASNPAVKLAHFIIQHGATLRAYQQAGVDLDSLLDLRMEQLSPVTRCRMNRKSRDIADAGLTAVMRLAREIIGNNALDHYRRAAG